MDMEFQAVVLAGGAGDRLRPYTEDISKPLLPICNSPMVAHPLRSLLAAGFRSIIVVTCTKYKPGLERFLGVFCEQNQGVQCELRAVADDSDTGTALREVADLLTKDFIVVGCDLVTDYPLKQILRAHQKNNATCTVAMRPCPKPGKTKDADAMFKNERRVQEYLGYDAESLRLQFFAADTEVADALQFMKAGLHARPNMTLSCQYMDINCYVFANWVAGFIAGKEAINSLKHEMIPILTNQQFKGQAEDGKWGRLRHQIPSSAPKIVDFDNLPERTAEFKAEFRNYFSALMDGAAGLDASDRLRCFVHMVDDPEFYCYRTLYTSDYWEANMELAKRVPEGERGVPARPEGVAEKDFRIKDNNVMGPDFEGDGTSVTVKGSIIGRNVRLGEGCRVTNSLLMDGVVVEAKAAVSNSLLGSSLEAPLIVQERSSLNSVQVQAGQKVSGDLKSESVLRADEPFSRAEKQ